MRRERRWPIPFLDFSTTLLVYFVGLFAIAIFVISDAETSQKADTTSKLLIALQWGDGSRNDVDLWLKTPGQNIVGFREKQADFASLDHDNKGTDSDNTAFDENGNVVRSDRRDEVIFVRQTVPGTYSVNIHAYSMIDGPETVTVSLVSVEPKYRVVFTRKLVLTDRREEITAMRFTVDAGGAVTGTDILQEEYVNKYLSGEL